MEEEQLGFKNGRGCVDLGGGRIKKKRKYTEKNKCVYLTFMDLEKAFNGVNRKAMWQVLQMHARDEVPGRAVKSFHEKSKKE